MMDLFRRGELGLLGGGEGLRDDVGVSGISWSTNRMPEDVYPASGLALAAAYHDIKTRLASLERENSSIKRKLKHYEVKVDSTLQTYYTQVHTHTRTHPLPCSTFYIPRLHGFELLRQILIFLSSLKSNRTTEYCLFVLRLKKMHFRIMTQLSKIIHRSCSVSLCNPEGKKNYFGEMLLFPEESSSFTVF